MRRFALQVALAGLALATPAAAQIQPDVTVNPNASGTRVLLYPGGKYGRVQRELLQPGEPYPGLPIVLHMPRKHPHHRVAAAKPKPKTPKVEVAAAPSPDSPRPPRQQATTIPKESAASLLMDEMAKQQPAKARPAPVAPKPAPPKQQVAVIKPPPAKPAPAPTPKQDDTFGVVSGSQVQQPETKTASIDTSAARNSIMFAPGAEEPPVSAIDSIKGMTASLNAALWSGTAHIQLEAFGGKPNDKSSDARRLSLKRALIVRQLLIDDGIPSERIVVRAMGGAPSGAPDRVDIFVAA